MRYQEIGFDMFNVEEGDGHATVQACPYLCEDGIVLAIPIGSVTFPVAEYAVHGMVVFFYGFAAETIMGIHVLNQETGGLKF